MCARRQPTTPIEVAAQLQLKLTVQTIVDEDWQAAVPSCLRPSPRHRPALAPHPPHHSHTESPCPHHPQKAKIQHARLCGPVTYPLSPVTKKQAWSLANHAHAASLTSCHCSPPAPHHGNQIATQRGRQLARTCTQGRQGCVARMPRGGGRLGRPQHPFLRPRPCQHRRIVQYTHTNMRHWYTC